jgi:8-oxo-dGTP pyrophosphatase MutT (NUDIX family)
MDVRPRIAGRLLSEIDDLTPVATGYVLWGSPGVRLAVSCYLTEKQPPPELVVSARAVLAGPGGTVFVFDDDGAHVLPGGRREKDEPVAATLDREIREEAGCAIVGPVRPIGFIEFRLEGPLPDGYRYPYPANFHLVFSASAGPVTLPASDPHVKNGRFVPRDEALALETPWAERVFLEAVLDGGLGGAS